MVENQESPTVPAELGRLAKEIRKMVLQICHLKQTAHLGSALSVVDILTVLTSRYQREGNHILLSKGHAALALYSCLFNLGYISETDLHSYSDKGSIFEEHPNHKVPTVPFATGSLGHGLPLGCGLAIGEKLKTSGKKVFVVMSDGECNEGTVWEAAQFAKAKCLDNLTVLVDHNKLQATGRTSETLSDISVARVFAGFGWNVAEVDGHSHDSISTSLESKLNNGNPNAVICHTRKGYGVSFMEDDNNWHYRAPNEVELAKALEELSQSA